MAQHSTAQHSIPSYHPKNKEERRKDLVEFHAASQLRPDLLGLLPHRSRPDVPRRAAHSLSAVELC
eukprot:3704510-Rhodomonas_salina.1